MAKGLPNIPPVFSLLGISRRAILQLSVLCALTTGLASCSIWEVDTFTNRDFRTDNIDIPERTTAPRPIYAREDAYDIYGDVPRVISNGISSFEVNNLLFTIDIDLGIHIADNSNPSAPRRITFVVIPGVRTASADQNRLYANNFTDLVTIDISDLADIAVVSRQENFYDAPPAFPPNYRGLFECYDASQGPLLGWENATVTRPQCRIL